jgi:hypothetical protein
MKVDPASKTPGAFRRAISSFENITGQFAPVWAVIALLNLATQAILFREMVGTTIEGKTTGEFGTFNAALGIIGLLTLPALALQVAFRLFFSRAQSTRLDQLRESSVAITETFAWAWSVCCGVLVLLPSPLPRFSLQLFTLMNVLLALGALISHTICAAADERRRWTLLLVGAGVARLGLGGWFTAYQPWAEAALAAFLLAGFITLAPALHPREIKLAARLKACSTALDGPFLVFAGATLSVLLGLYLFTNADRIVALRWMNITIGETAFPSARLEHIFDVYQAVGLLARALLWGTQPLLWLLYAERAKLDQTTPASLRFFWLYLGALLVGALVLGWLGRRSGPIDALISAGGSIAPTFAAVMIPLGLLQGLGIFCLASRRYPECFVLGGCSLVYALILAIVGRRPETMLPYMFGSSVVALMILLFVGVVRWGRKQP